MTVAKSLIPKPTDAMTVVVIMTVILVIAAMTTAVKTVTVAAAAAVPVRVRSYFNLFRDVLDLIHTLFYRM